MAGILGQPVITKYLLDSGADSNIRSTYALGLRMHPLSWNVYHGHVENVRLLLTMGKADVNLDFDHMSKSGVAVTVLDVIEEILANTEESHSNIERYRELRALLLAHGAKRFEDLAMGTTNSEL